MCACACGRAHARVRVACRRHQDQQFGFPCQLDRFNILSCNNCCTRTMRLVASHNLYDRDLMDSKC